MSNKQPNPAQTVIFVAIISVICALLLSFVSSALKDRQDAAKSLDIQKSILDSLLVVKTELNQDAELPSLTEVSPKEVSDFIENRIETIIIDQNGKDITEEVVKERGGDLKKIIAKINLKKEEQAFKDEKQAYIALPVYILYKSSEKKEIQAFSLHIWGKGLWGPINGYMSIKADGKTVHFINFLGDHKETPGLGKEMERESWRAQFKGQKIFEGEKLVGIKVVKGKVADKVANEEQRIHYVDGLSGATITANGISEMIRRCLGYYQPYLEQQQGKKSSVQAEKNDKAPTKETKE